MMHCSMRLVESVRGCMGKGRDGRGFEEGLNWDWWRQRVWGLNLANGSAGVELILFALELSGFGLESFASTQDIYSL